MRFILIFIFLVIRNGLFAQFPNPASFNSATNATFTGTLAIGLNDLNWSSALTNSLGPYVPAVVCGNQAIGNWVNSPFPNANWITYPHSCSASPAEHSCLGNVDEFFRLIINLPNQSCTQPISTPSAYCLSFDFFADNWVSAVYVNNVLSFNNPNPNPYGALGFTMGGKLTVSLCNNWVPGTNTVIVHVKSGAPSFPGWAGFLAQANHTINTTVGIPVSATVTGTDPTCVGGSNGSATVMAGGSAGPYTYTWLPSGGSGSVATGLSAGIYTVAVSNLSGCITNATVQLTSPPSFSLSVSQGTSICNGGAAFIGAGGASSYTWSNGGNTPSITVTTPGIYTVSGSNSLGCISSNTVGVLSSNNPTVFVSGNDPVCAGETIILTASGASSYLWSNGATNSSVTLNLFASENLTVTGTDVSGCFSSYVYSVNVFPLPDIGITGSTAFCINDLIQLQATGANSYTWNGSFTGPTYTSAAVSNTTVMLAGTNTLTGCTKTVATNIIVGNYPLITLPSYTVCKAQTATLTANGASSYTWSNGFVGNPLIYSPLISGTISVYGSGSIGQCTASASGSILVMESPLITITALPKPLVCEGDSVILSAEGSSAYYWSNGKVGSVIKVLPAVPGSTYAVYSYDQNTGCRGTATVNITVNSLPVIQIKELEFMCVGEFTQLQAFGASDYLWSNGAVSHTILMKVEEGKSVSVTGIDLLNGCANTITYQPKVSSECCELWIPNTFSPNADGSNDLFGPYSLCNFTTYKFEIFNRWGELIFSSDKIETRWNGEYKNKPVQDGVYTYLLSAEKLGKGGGGNSVYINKAGHINVLR